MTFKSIAASVLSGSGILW